MFAFHHVNAYEDGGEVVVDLCVYPDAGIIEDLYLERLRAGAPVTPATLTRYRLGLADRSVRSERLTGEPLELPRINYGRCNERPYRYVWGNSNGPQGWIEEILKVDTASGETLSWSQPGCYPGEPVFVARPQAEDEDDGVLLSVVLDAAAGIIVPARARRCRSERAGASAGAPPHPLRLSRPVRAGMSSDTSSHNTSS